MEWLSEQEERDLAAAFPKWQPVPSCALNALALTNEDRLFLGKFGVPAGPLPFGMGLRLVISSNEERMTVLNKTKAIWPDAAECLDIDVPTDTVLAVHRNGTLWTVDLMNTEVPRYMNASLRKLMVFLATLRRLNVSLRRQSPENGTGKRMDTIKALELTDPTAFEVPNGYWPLVSEQIELGVIF